MELNLQCGHYCRHFWEFRSCPFRHFRHNLRITVAYHVDDEAVGKCAEDVNLIPVFLVHVPCCLYLVVVLTQLECQVWVAFQYEPFRIAETYHCENLVHDAEGKRILVEWKVFGSSVGVTGSNALFVRCPWLWRSYRIVYCKPTARHIMSLSGIVLLRNFCRT